MREPMFVGENRLKVNFLYTLEKMGMIGIHSYIDVMTGLKNPKWKIGASWGK
jgi:hypothetical protein